MVIRKKVDQMTYNEGHRRLLALYTIGDRTSKHVQHVQKHCRVLSIPKYLRHLAI